MGVGGGVWDGVDGYSTKGACGMLKKGISCT